MLPSIWNKNGILWEVVWKIALLQGGRNCRTVLFVLLNKILLLVCNTVGEKNSLNNGMCLLQTFSNILIAETLIEHERISMNLWKFIYYLNVETKCTVLCKNKMEKKGISYFCLFVFPFWNRALFVLSVWSLMDQQRSCSSIMKQFIILALIQLMEGKVICHRKGETVLVCACAFVPVLSCF